MTLAAAGIGRLSSEGDELVDTWEHTRERVEKAERELNSARCALSNATNALGRWLSPSDGKPEESYSIWRGSQMLTVSREKREMYSVDGTNDTRIDYGDYIITVRQRMKPRNA